MVADSYSHRLLSEFGYEFEEYDELSDWLGSGVRENHSKVEDIYQRNA